MACTFLNIALLFHSKNKNWSDNAEQVNNWIIIIIKKILAMQGWEREIDTLTVRRPQPHTTNLQRKRRERENSWLKRREQLGQQKGIGPALETCQCHTIEYGVNQIIPERYSEGNKSPAVLRGSAAGRRISIPMCDQSTACNPDDAG